MTRHMLVALASVLLAPAVALAQDPDEGVVFSALTALAASPGSTDALDGLRELGARAIPRLRKALESGRVERRAAAARALGLLPHGGVALDDLLRALGDGEARVRAAAAFALRWLTLIAEPAPDEGARKAIVEALLTRVGDPEPTVCAEVAVSLGELGGPGIVPTLLERLSGRDDAARATAAEALGVVQSSHGLVGPEPGHVVKALLDRGADGSAVVRWKAAAALAQIAPFVREDGPRIGADQAFLVGVGDADERVRAACVYGLLRLTSTHADADLAGKVREALSERLDDPSPHVRGWAAQALAEELVSRHARGPGVERVAGRLAALLQRDPAASVRKAAAVGLARLGAGARGVKPALEAASEEDPSPDVREAARRALEAIH